MGKLVSNKTYERYEYLVAVLISLGMMAFLFGKVGFFPFPFLSLCRCGLLNFLSLYFSLFLSLTHTHTI